MSCFWDSLLAGLNSINNKFNSPIDLVRYIKANNKETIDVHINSKLSKQRLEENLEAIVNYNENSINDGYLCSSEDPFLFLVSQLFQLNIYFNFNGNLINYKNISAKYNLYLVSSATHCSFQKIELVL
jgi:hypothetical protein